MKSSVSYLLLIAGDVERLLTAAYRTRSRHRRSQAPFRSRKPDLILRRPPRGKVYYDSWEAQIPTVTPLRRQTAIFGTQMPFRTTFTTSRPGKRSRWPFCNLLLVSFPVNLNRALFSSETNWRMRMPKAANSLVSHPLCLMPPYESYPDSDL